MESQDKRMCNPESFWSSGTIAGGTVAYDHVYDEDCFSDILNIFDFPMESLEGDGFAEDWASKLGPIPTEVFKDTHVACNTNSFSADLLPDYCNGRTSQLKHQSVLCNRTSKDYQNDMASQLKRQPTFFEEPTRQNIQRPYPCDIKTVESFQAHSPDSVLESRSSSSTSKGISFGSEIAIPVRTRSKRSRPTANPWFLSPLIFPINKEKRKRKKLPQPSVNVEVKNSLGRSNVARIKMCTHCEITKTPQWREGPLGPKTLCNACGVRYRSGRLYPEYRPAASPTFVPSLHSNSHRKVIEMREKAIRIQKGPVVNDVKKSLVSTPPEFAPVSSSLLFNCMQDLRN